MNNHINLIKISEVLFKIALEFKKIPLAEIDFKTTNVSKRLYDKVNCSVGCHLSKIYSEYNQDYDANYYNNNEGISMFESDCELISFTHLLNYSGWFDHNHSYLWSDPKAYKSHIIDGKVYTSSVSNLLIEIRSVVDGNRK